MKDKIKREITLPDNWSEVSVKQFQDLSTIDNNDPYRTEMVIKILSGADLDLITSMDVETRNKSVNHLLWTNTFPDDTYYKTEIIIDDIPYNVVELSGLALGKWIDLDNYCKNPIDNIHKILSILYQPVNGRTNPEVFLKANIGEVYQAVVFFSNIVINLIKNLPNYAERKMTELLKSLEESQQKTDKQELN